MALCTGCGKGEHQIKNNKDRTCGNCGADDWLEWEDFFDRPWMKNYVHLNASYWKLIIDKIGVKDMIEFMILVLDSEVEHYSRGEGLTFFFKYKLSDEVRKAIKNV